MGRKVWTHIVPEVTRDYWQLVMVVAEKVPAGMYGLDQKRAEAHSALCRYYGLTKEEASNITGNLDRMPHGSESLHYALQDLAMAKPASPAGGKS